MPSASRSLCTTTRSGDRATPGPVPARWSDGELAGGRGRRGGRSRGDGRGPEPLDHRVDAERQLPEELGGGREDADDADGDEGAFDEPSADMAEGERFVRRSRTGNSATAVPTLTMMSRPSRNPPREAAATTDWARVPRRICRGTSASALPILSSRAIVQPGREEQVDMTVQAAGAAEGQDAGRRLVRTADCGGWPWDDRPVWCPQYRCAGACRSESVA